MVKYNTNSWRLLTQRKGSVFPQACWYAFLTAFASGLLKYLDEAFLSFTESMQLNGAVFSGLTFTLSCILVFRTSQCYGRFCGCASSITGMRCELHEAAVCLVSFSRVSKLPDQKVNRFVHQTLRLFSLLHACALEAISEVAHKEFPIIDLDGLDQPHIEFLSRVPPRSRVNVVYQWINSLLVDGIQDGMIDVPAPICTRIFQQLEKSKQEYSNLSQMMCIPFPFPYVQAAKVLVILYGVLTAFVMTFWGRVYWHAFLFTFISTMGPYSIEITASELENPFGEDPNDLPCQEFQEDMNDSLLLLLQPLAYAVPRLTDKADLNLEHLLSHQPRCFLQVVVDAERSSELQPDADEILLSTGVYVARDSLSSSDSRPQVTHERSSTSLGCMEQQSLSVGESSCYPNQPAPAPISLRSERLMERQVELLDTLVKYCQQSTARFPDLAGVPHHLIQHEPQLSAFIPETATPLLLPKALDK